MTVPSTTIMSLFESEAWFSQRSYSSWASPSLSVENAPVRKVASPSPRDLIWNQVFPGLSRYEGKEHLRSVTDSCHWMAANTLFTTEHCISVNP